MLCSSGDVILWLIQTLRPYNVHVKFKSYLDFVYDIREFGKFIKIALYNESKICEFVVCVRASAVYKWMFEIYYRQFLVLGV